MSFLSTIEEAIAEIKAGRMVIVTDDVDRENEGDLIMAADAVTPEAINFMATHARGLVCAPLSKDRAQALHLDPMVSNNDSLHHTAFTISVDAVKAGTGISCFDRSTTLKALVDGVTRPQDLLRPGHIFPLVAKKGGVLVRSGHTEAAVDLVRFAGRGEVGVICEILNEDGSMARLDDLERFGKKHNLKCITIKDLIEYRRRNEVTISETGNIDFPCKFGQFRLRMFESLINKNEHHVAFVKGDVNTDEPVLVRVHSECLTGDIFGSLRCDCGSQLEQAMALIEKEGRGVLLYLRQEGRGIGLPNKIRAYHLQDQGLDTVEANVRLGFKPDLREFGTGACILQMLGLKKLRVITNNPKKLVGLDSFGLEIVERVSTKICVHERNQHYLETKRDKMGHILPDDFKESKK